MAKPMKGVSSVDRKEETYWYAQVDGRKTYCGKGPEGRKMAEASRAKWVAKQYENREQRAGLKVKKPTFRTIRELMNWYMELPSTQAQKAFDRKVIAAKHLTGYFGNKALNQAEGDDQERYRSLRGKQGAASRTIDYEIVVLRAMFNAARKRKKISADLMPGQFIQERKVNPRRRITPEEYQELLDHAKPDFRDVLICGYESAMRSSEICGLTAGQVHLDVKHISGQVMDYIDLGIFDTKTGARRTVPISPELKEVMERRLKGLKADDRVFSTTRGLPFTNYSSTDKMRWTCKKAGIPYGDKTFNKKGEKVGIVFHCLRHTRASLWVEAGFSDEIIRRATGHKSLEAYKTYIKLDPSAVMRLVDGKRSKTDNSRTKTTESQD